MRGYFGIGIYQPKTIENVGTLWRSAQNFGAAFIFTIGTRYTKQCSDTLNTFKHIPLFNYKDVEEFNGHRPFSSILIAIEQTEKSEDIKTFIHPQQSVYLLGAEDNGLPKNILEKCQNIVHISTPMCLNVSVAGSIIMFDRMNKKNR
jgi:tRNA(Leu) C34 or U34 (ribose-2'-O)-methylase TrmL